MLRVLARQGLRIPLLLFGVLSLLFVIFHTIPGNEAMMAAGATATQAAIDAMRHQLGLDRPLLVQYASWIHGLLHGSLGFSPTFRGNPLPEILARVPATLALTGSAIALTVALGLPAGIAAAAFRGRGPDLVISGAVSLLLAVPNFWLGMMLAALFAIELGWLPALGLTGASSLVLPSLALAARLIALVARLARGVMIEEMRQDYVRTALAKGLSWRVTLIRHVLRNALIPIITVIGLQTGYLLGGSVVIERLFDWPGIGDLLLTAVGLRDYAVVQGITVLFVLGFLIINLTLECLYVALNPRLR